MITIFIIILYIMSFKMIHPNFSLFTLFCKLFYFVLTFLYIGFDRILTLESQFQVHQSQRMLITQYRPMAAVIGGFFPAVLLGSLP